MKALPKRKGNANHASVRVRAVGLNEGPSEKEGKLDLLHTLPTKTGEPQ